MDRSVLFVVDNDRLHHFVARDELGSDVMSVLQRDLGVTVGETVLPIAHWEHDRTGPLSVALNFAGELVVLVTAENFSNQAVLVNTLSTLEQWLAPMDLRDLSELSGDPDRFAEGLVELSPRIPLTLASMMRVLLINPDIDLDPHIMSASLPFSRIETLRIEALEAADGTVTIKRSHEVSDSLGDTLPMHDSMPITLQLDLEPRPPKVTVEDTPAEPLINASNDAVDAEVTVGPQDETIDLTLDETPTAHQPADQREHSEPGGRAAVSDWPTLIRGSHYVTAELPLHFDPSGTDVHSISDQLFSAGSHLALVVDLDDLDSSPVETSTVFRWDAGMEHRALFDGHEFDAQKRRRTIHVFVESATQPNRVFYLGSSDRLAEGNGVEAGATWFKLRSPLEQRWLTPLRAKTMPTLAHDASLSFRPQAPAHALPGHWVPSV